MPRTESSLQRTTFRTSRVLDFFSDKELVAQTGHAKEYWPLLILKELADNAVDACEDARIAPVVDVTVDGRGITVTDNGPGIPPPTVAGVLDFSVRVSSREAYVAPTRGAQGNALKTLVAMPFVLDGEQGRVEIASRGVRHVVTLRVDRIRQQPTIDHQQTVEEIVRNGTVVTVHWPSSASSILDRVHERFLQIASAYSILNPHLAMTVRWGNERAVFPANTPKWKKWLPSHPTSAHWYEPAHFERLLAAYLAHDADRGVDRTVRELVAEFHGMSGTAKQKAVLAATGLARMPLSALAHGQGLRSELVSPLLSAMKKVTQPVKPEALGVLGRDHLARCFEALDCEMETFAYRKLTGVTDGLPWLIETAFAWRPDCDEPRRLITGINWSPGIINPFRQLGKHGQSLDSLLEQQRAGSEEPVVLVLHLACPRVAFTDRGKGSVVLDSFEEK